MKKIYKYFEYFYTKIVQKTKQKKIQFHNINLKYMFYGEKKSRDLVIVFSACTRKGVKARYNYVRTLKKVKINKLFILDNFGLDNRGEYYMGEAPEFYLEKSVDVLIDKFIKKYDRIYFVGSSKGGFAALNFGLKYDEANIIVGAPQFYLGNYLSEPPNKITYDSMNLDDKYVKYLNKKLIIELQQKKKNIKIYIHYSNREHTYQEHIKDLIHYIKKYKIYLREDIKKYENHGDVSLYFPKFLLDIIQEGGKK